MSSHEVIEDCGCISTKHEGKTVYLKYCEQAMAAIKQKERRPWAPSDGKLRAMRIEKRKEVS